MKLTVQVQLLPSAEQATNLLDTMRAVNAAAMYAARVGFDSKYYGRTGVHRLCYRSLRDRFGLSAQMAVRAIGKAVEALARDHSVCPEFRLEGAIPLDDRLYRLSGLQEVSLSTLAGRIRVPFVVGDYFRGLLSRRMGQADLICRNGRFFLLVSVEVEEPAPIDPKDWLGVDFGLVNIATDSTGERFSGEDFERQRRRRTTARRTYQMRNTRNARRRLRRMARRQARHQRSVNHNVSKRIVAKAKALGAGITLEDLNGIRSRVEPTVNRRLRRRIGNWSFAQLRSFVEYKARLGGVPVVAVNPRGTSTTCSACGHREKANRPDQATFRCAQCNFSCNADHNAALNLARLGATVSGPDLAAAP
jgi:IS605 OrfB family transposase